MNKNSNTEPAIEKVSALTSKSLLKRLFSKNSFSPSNLRPIVFTLLIFLPSLLFSLAGFSALYAPKYLIPLIAFALMIMGTLLWYAAVKVVLFRRQLSLALNKLDLLNKLEGGIVLQGIIGRKPSVGPENTTRHGTSEQGEKITTGKLGTDYTITEQGKKVILH